MRLDRRQTRTGMSASGILKRYTNSESATRPRNSFERTTSDSISSTATRARVESGPPCSRMTACWTRTQRLAKHTSPIVHHETFICKATDANYALKEDYLDGGRNTQIAMCPTAHRFHRKDHYVHCSKVAGFHKDDWSLSSLDQIFARNPQKSVSVRPRLPYLSFVLLTLVHQSQIDTNLAAVCCQGNSC